MDIKNYLPLGSVVRLKNATRKLVIIGINQNAENKTFDYSSVLYPYGYMNSEELFLFNNKDIEEIVYKGYSDKELENFYEDLVWSINKKKEEKENE